MIHECVPTTKKHGGKDLKTENKCIFILHFAHVRMCTWVESQRISSLKVV